MTDHTELRRLAEGAIRDDQSYFQVFPEDLLSLLDEVEQLKARLEQAEAVIAPFGELWREATPSHQKKHDDEWFYGFGATYITVGHLRAAADFMEAQDD